MSKTENARATDPNQESNGGEQGFLADIWELARFPLALAILAIAVTWVVWFNTTEPCTDTMTAGCRSPGWGKHINLDLLNKMFAHGGIAGGFGGIGSYAMFTRERRAREAAERRAEAAERRTEAAERRLEEERRRHDELIQEILRRIPMVEPPPANGGQSTDSGSA